MSEVGNDSLTIPIPEIGQQGESIVTLSKGNMQHSLLNIKSE